MKLASINKTFVLRAFACVLLLVSLALTVAQETNSFSESKVFVKAHSLTSDGFGQWLSVNDIEDTNEDGSIDSQVSADFAIELFSIGTSKNNSAIRFPTKERLGVYETFILHHQFLI